MKSNIVLTSAAALLISVGANALEYHPFVGASMGLQGVSYSNHGKDVEKIKGWDFPTDFFVFGLETGVRAGSYFDIYNGGLTLSATKTTYSNINKKFVDSREARADQFNMALTYDSYIRISGDKENRIDLVLGAGLGTMAYHIAPVNGDSSTKWSFAPEIKAGLDFELIEHLVLSANVRAIFPRRPDYEAGVTYITGGAIKYIF
jgi:hypothetical protein